MFVTMENLVSPLSPLAGPPGSHLSACNHPHLCQMSRRLGARLSPPPRARLCPRPPVLTWARPLHAVALGLSPPGALLPPQTAFPTTVSAPPPSPGPGPAQGRPAPRWWVGILGPRAPCHPQLSSSLAHEGVASDLLPPPQVASCLLRSLVAPAPTGSTCRPAPCSEPVLWGQRTWVQVLGSTPS